MIDATVASGVTGWTPAILQGLIANSLYSLLGHAGRLIRVRGHGTDAAIKKSIASSGLEAIVGFGPLGAGSADQLKEFLASPETEAVLRQIYSFRLTEGKNGGLESIRSEFSRLLQGRVPGADDKLSRSLFKVILGICDDALNAALEDSTFSALEAKSVFRHRILADELAALAHNVELLSAKPNIAEILEFEERYREQVASRHDSISPPHLDRQKKFPIDALYVAPNLTRYVDRQHLWHHRPQDVIKTDQMLSWMQRAVLLGNPGAGKSTFALKLCHDLSTSSTLAGRRVSPILVVLRDYGAQKKDHNISIVQFVVGRSDSWYQITPPARAFEYLLLNRRAVVIFDGLDELLETSYRREIGDDIEAFCNLYPSTPVIVTSRVVGYEQAPLDPRKFEPFRLADFDDEQVGEYASKWFATDENSTPDQQRKRTQAFLNESRSVPDLRSNPLMLALMCNIYLGEDFIPTNRPDVYKKCALMLFDRWDRSRRIHTGYGFENQLSPIMTQIAHWLYSAPALQSGVTEQQLIQECAKYLHARRYEQFEEAEKAATDFIEFCRGRAWVFSDTGTTPGGMNLYQFTHRTFLEYFTALYLFRTNPKPSELLSVLQPKIAKREWDVVAQLAFHIASREVEGAADDLMLGLLQAAKAKPASQMNFLTFAGCCLEFVSCSPKATRSVAEATLEAHLNWASAVVQSGKTLRRSPTPSDADDLVSNLLHTSDENRGTVAETIEAFLDRHMNGPDETKALLSAEVAITLMLLIHRRSSRTHPNPELTDYWKPKWSQMMSRNLRTINDLMRKSSWVALAGAFVGVLPPGELVAWHGPKAIFKESPSSTYVQAWSPLGHPYLYQLINAPTAASSQIRRHEERELGQIGDALMKSKTPWTSKPDYTNHLISWICEVRYPTSKAPDAPPAVPTNALFAGFLLAAAAIEAIERTKETALLLRRLSQPDARFGLLGPVRNALLARIGSGSVGEVKAELNTITFTPEQAEFILRWAAREVNLVRHHGKRLAPAAFLAS